MSARVPDDLREALREFTSRRPVLVALDFDGVLSPIVPRPSEARPLPATAAALRRLVATDGVHVAFVSGRHLEDLRVVAEPPDGSVLVGSHGAEVDGAPAPEVPAEVLASVSAALHRVSAQHPGTTIEDKPTAAVLHTRNADPSVAAAATDAAVAAVAVIDGADAMIGKQVVEVAVVTADKGTAVRELRQRLGVAAVLYAGDDVTDENALRALDPATDVGIKVGDGDTAASFRVDTPEDVTAVLEALLDALR